VLDLFGEIEIIRDLERGLQNGRFLIEKWDLIRIALKSFRAIRRRHFV
jgi:hypothetical protein